MVPWICTSSYPKRHIDRFIRFCVVHACDRETISLGDPSLQLIHDPLACTSPDPNGISIGSTVCVVHARDTQTPVHRPRYVCNDRPHLMLCIAMLPSDVDDGRSLAAARAWNIERPPPTTRGQIYKTSQEDLKKILEKS